MQNPFFKIISNGMAQQTVIIDENGNILPLIAGLSFKTTQDDLLNNRPVTVTVDLALVQVEAIVQHFTFEDAHLDSLRKILTAAGYTLEKAKRN